MTLYIKGRVQKVGFRYSVANFVIESTPAVTGYVKNLSDGSVEVLAEGDLEELKELHRFCQKGPPHSEVRAIEQELEPSDKRAYQRFVIID